MRLRANGVIHSRFTIFSIPRTRAACDQQRHLHDILQGRGANDTRRGCNGGAPLDPSTPTPTTAKPTARQNEASAQFFLFRLDATALTWHPNLLLNQGIALWHMAVSQAHII